jgi:hypothetical protein
MYSPPVLALTMIHSLGLLASCTKAGRIDLWDYALLVPVFSHTLEEPVTALAWRERENEVIAGCDSGRVLAVPIPRGVQGSADAAERAEAAASAAASRRSGSLVPVPPRAPPVGGAAHHRRAAVSTSTSTSLSSSSMSSSSSLVPPPTADTGGGDSSDGSDPEADDILNTLKRLSIANTKKSQGEAPQRRRFPRQAASEE